MHRCLSDILQHLQIRTSMSPHLSTLDVGYLNHSAKPSSPDSDATAMLQASTSLVAVGTSELPKPNNYLTSIYMVQLAVLIYQVR